MVGLLVLNKVGFRGGLGLSRGYLGFVYSAWWVIAMNVGRDKIKFLDKEFVINALAADDHISKAIRESGLFYEFEMLNYLRLYGSKGGCAIDVGANIGNHSIFFSAFLADYVISIEANVDLIPVLKKNLLANKCSYEVVSSAVGAELGSGKIYFPLENNIGAGRVSKGSGDIEITTLDTVSPTEGVFLVKIDVEGMEMDVLLGAQELIASQRPDLIVEAPTMPEFSAIDAFLRPYGYRVLSRWNSTPTYHFSCNHGIWVKAKVSVIRIYIRFQRLLRKIARHFTQ